MDKKLIFKGIRYNHFHNHSALTLFISSPVVFSSDNWSNAENDYFTQAYSYTSFVYFVPGNLEFEDMVVYFQGAIFDKTLQKIVLLDRKVRFEYKNGQFTTTEKLPDEEE